MRKKIRLLIALFTLGQAAMAQSPDFVIASPKNPHQRV